MLATPWWDRFEARLATVLAGLGTWVAAATATRPDWAPWWSGWVLSFIGIAVALVGFIRLLLSARDASTRPPLRSADRTALAELLQQGQRKYANVHDLDIESPNADQRGEALRLWSERWEHDVESAFGDEEIGLRAFTRDVDTSQMHYRRSPVHRLSVKLDRLQHYLGRQFTAEAVLVPPMSDELRPPNRPPMNTPIGLVGQPWVSVGRPGFMEVFAVVPRRAPPAIGSTVSVLDGRYRVLGVSPARDPSVHLDGTESLVRLDVEEESTNG